MSFSEGFVGDSGKEFFERHASKSDFGVGQGSVGIIVGLGFGFGFGFLKFAEFENFSCDAHFGHEFGDFGSRAVEETGIFFKLVHLLGSHAAAGFWEEFFRDVRACGPFPEIFFFFVGGVGLRECEPVTLDLEVIVGKGGTAEAGDVVGEMAESVPFAVGVGFGVDEAGHSGELELGPEEEFVNDMNAMRLVIRSACCVLREVVRVRLG